MVVVVVAAMVVVVVTMVWSLALREVPISRCCRRRDPLIRPQLRSVLKEWPFCGVGPSCVVVY